MRSAGPSHLLRERRCKLLERVFDAQVGNGRQLAGQSRDGHHEREVAQDSVGHARVPHLHRHHLAGGEAWWREGKQTARVSAKFHVP